MLKYKFNLKDISLADFKVYLAAMFKAVLPKGKLKNLEDLKKFIQQKSAWVTQVTLYNYLKTRMGAKHVLMFEDKDFLKSINIAKWHIYAVSLIDCTFFCFSYLYKEKNFSNIEEANKIFFEMLGTNHYHY